MTFLPIVGRELRVASRRRGTYWVRTGAALAVMVLGTWFFLMMRNEPAREVAMALFGILTGSAVLYCLLSGVRSTADCLSEEKREGTLGLLFLTDLKGYDVVVGKLAGTSLNAFYGILAVVPMLAIPLLMGGVTLGEFGRMALVAVNTLFFSLTIGICISALSRDGRRARGFTFIIIVLFAAVLPACSAWRELVGRSRQLERLLLLPSPGYTYYMAWDMWYKTGSEHFWHSLLTIHGLGWLFLLVAALVAPRGWQDKPASVQRLRWRERWLLWSYGNHLERLAFRRRLLDRSAYFWLAARARLKPAMVWGVLGFLACGWVWGLTKFDREWVSGPMCLVTAIILNVLIKGWFASESGRQLAEDRQHGTLELLLSTPLTVPDILRGQTLALWRQFLGPVLVVLATFFTFMLVAITETRDDEDKVLWILFWLAAMTMLIADLVALYWVGLWQALVARNPHRAASGTLARILVLPWLTIAAVALAISLAMMNSRAEPGPKFFLGLWFVVGLGTDFLFASRARFKLLTEFRVAATQKYERRRGRFKRSLPPRQRPAPPVIVAQQ